MPQESLFQKDFSKSVGDVQLLEQFFVHLSRIALSGRSQDVQRLLQRAVRQLRETRPEVARHLADLLREAPTSTSPLRGDAMGTMPVDSDSRLSLARVEDPPLLDQEPLWATEVAHPLAQLVKELQSGDQLFSAGLYPTRTAIFTGPPGVGKTLAARWIALQTQRPLIILDLAAVMSSYLGRTGANLRSVLDYAKSARCVLLLDEIDAIAKRRDDDVEVGELKRLVTVLLQEVDDWPTTSLLIAATNHPNLLDPAVWRRFEVIVEFPMPTVDQTRQAVEAFLRVSQPRAVIDTLSALLHGVSFSEIERDLLLLQRTAVLNDIEVSAVLPVLVKARCTALPSSDRRRIALQLRSLGWSARLINETTGVSRDYLREKSITETEKPRVTRREKRG